MAQDLTGKKSDFASSTVAMADRLLKLAQACDEIVAFWFANSLNQGAANAYTQNDLAGANSHLTPQMVIDVVSACDGVRTTVTQGMRDNLRRAATRPDI